MFPKVTNNNYSSWEPVFFQELETKCKDPFAYLSQVSIVGDDIARRVFGSLSSPYSVFRMTHAINYESYGDYLKSRPGMLVFWAFALLILVSSIAISFFALKRCRSCFKCAPVDRPRLSAKNMPKTATFILSVGGVALVLVAVVLSSLVAAYSSRVLAGTSGVGCDTMQTLHGYFFGSNGRSTPSNVVTDWQGSNSQFEAMSALRDSMNPKPATGGRCPLCQQIEKKFEELKTELVPLGKKNRDISAKGVIMIEAFKVIVAKCARAKVTKSKKFTVTAASAATAYDKNLQKSMTERSAAFNDVIELAIGMFQQNIDEMLGHSSPVLTNSHAAAVTSLVGVADIDSIFARVLEDWVDMSPVLFALFRSVGGLCLAICILVFLLSGVGIYMGAQVIKSRRSDVPLSLRQTKGLGALFSTFAVLAGVTLFVSAFAFTVSIVVRDACDFAENEALAGNWQSLPSSLWQQTISNTTDMKAVMDTCIKEGGSGDIASSLGIRMVLQQLQDTLDTTSSFLLGLLDEKLDLKTKTEFIQILTNMISSSSRAFGFTRCQITIDAAFTASKEKSTSLAYFLRHLDQISPWEGDGRMSVLCLADAMMDDPSSIQKVIMTKCMQGLIETYETSTAALKFLNDMAVEAKGESTEGISSFCVPYLDHDNACATLPGDVFKLVYNEGNSPLLDERFLAVLEPFRGENKEDFDKLKTIIATASALADYQAWLEKPLAAAINLETVISPGALDPREALPELFPEEQPLSLSFVLAAIEPKFEKCVDPKQGCSVHDALKLWDAFMNLTADTVQETVLKGAEIIQFFVKNATLGTFENELGKAFLALDNFDCQFVGTSLVQGPLYGLCEIIGPNLLSLTIVCIFLSFVGVSAAIFTWQIFHYYHDINLLGTKEDIKHKNSSTEHPTTAARAS